MPSSPEHPSDSIERVIQVAEQSLSKDRQQLQAFLAALTAVEYTAPLSGEEVRMLLEALRILNTRLLGEALILEIEHPENRGPRIGDEVAIGPPPGDWRVWIEAATEVLPLRIVFCQKNPPGAE